MLVPPHKAPRSHLSHPKPGLHLYRNPNNTLCGGGLPSVKTLEPLAMVHTPAATVPIPPTSEDSHEAMQASGRSIHEEHVRSMEAVWHGEFSKLFSQFYPHLWYLIPSPAAPSPRWYRFRDSAKVRFSCQQCGNGWTSMKGRVIFWYYLNPQGVPVPEGYLHFKLYGQQCKRCKNGRFEMAMWYPEEVVKVLGNVYNRVGQTYYGFYQPPLRQDRRPGKPRTQHNAELCQACKDGECTNAH
ncbi:PREDICTED: receptor-transporting protein 4-like isoform X2 [Branchiostoma belcheri]|uniref:Receptor-transporting protein 4-like isoform X2 n=1 Tax=Branchiostoma belcheri TaxID=7741 RepID=A0A6P5A168_BRABE|nr:PREDICTED: receptor-transporting protein 4-like isoform X2 [Branchiostoma belcheri]